MSNTSTTSGGIGILGILLIVFIVLKLTGVIQWSWVWVLAPAWIQFAIFIVLVISWIVLQIIESRRR